MVRTVDGGEKLDAIAASKRMEFGRWEINGDIVRRMDRLACLTVVKADDIDGGRFVEVVEGADIAGEVRCDHGAVDSGPMSERLRTAAVQRNPVELAI